MKISTLDNNTAVGVIGAGSMGGGIAQLAAKRGHSVVVYDSFGDARARAQSGLETILERLVEKGRLDQSAAGGILGRITFADRLRSLRDCGCVIEAVYENIDAKKEVFTRIEEIVSTQCVLATNTSSLSISAIASVCRRPERVLGTHFFNPAPLMPLVEIVPGVRSAEEALSAARSLIDDWGKTTVMVKDTPGFIVNRVARPFYGEALRILDEGVANVATIDRAMKDIGEFRMGPFELMDFIGNDVNYRVTETIFDAFFYDPRYKPSFTQKRLVDAGLLGRKSGHGFYDYRKGAAAPEPMKDDSLAQQIFMRIVTMLINEAVDALFWNIASRDDIDLAMKKGVNYPKGLLRWADEIGLEAVLDQLNRLQEECGEDRYRPSPLLKRMVREKRTFY
jgi:3-hydroxybutyryl-CoA dehydrogenase